MNKLKDSIIKGQDISNVKEKNFITLRFKLILSFMIPILFIIILGVISYQKAANSIIENYENATVQSINMVGKYICFGIEAVEATAVQYMGDDSISKYFLNIYKEDDMEYNNKYQAITTVLKAKKATDDFIENIYLISDKVTTISTVSKNHVDIYGGFIATKKGEYLNTNRTKGIWIGQDDYLDVALGTTATDYSLRLIRNFTSAEALLVIDVSRGVLDKMLEELSFDQSSLVGIITEDGKEIIQNEPGENYFYNEEFYQNALQSKEDSGLSYVDYNDEEHLFIYSKIGKTGAMLCALMPKKTIISQAISIKKVTVIIVIIACVIAILIGVLISTGIDMTIKGIIVGLREAAKGNLTVSFTTKRKDEFYILISEIQNTFTNMKELLQQVKDLSGEVSDASIDVSKTSGMFLKSTKDIGVSIFEIEQGVSQQASDAEECLIQMEWLSKKIVMVNDSTKEINQIAEDTKYSIKEGFVVTTNLNNQTESTIEITTNIIDNIELLAEKSTSIEDIILVINEIASKTNLLSLNASIEAARAGEHGRGFAVVASEIRTLAQQSQQSVSDIKKIIGSIQDDTQSAVKTARNAENVLKLQRNAVKETTQSYQNINNKVENLMVYLDDITESIENIEEAKLSTLGSIESMSAVLEEIAASSGSVNHTSEKQLSAVDALNESAKKLNLNAENLAKGVYRFQV